MTDIVKRLRQCEKDKHCCHDYYHCGYLGLFEEAANEIERLREPLDFIASWYGKYHPPVIEITLKAKKALNK